MIRLIFVHLMKSFDGGGEAIYHFKLCLDTALMKIMNLFKKNSRQNVILYD